MAEPYWAKVLLCIIKDPMKKKDCPPILAGKKDFCYPGRKTEIKVSETTPTS